MLFRHHPLFLLSLFPLVDMAAVFFPSFYLQIGPFQFLPMDPLYFFTIIHLGICLLRQPRKIAGLLKKNMFLSIFFTMVAVYVVLYTPVYGQSAIGEARKFYFIFLIPPLAAISIKQPEDLRRFVLVIIFAATCVAVVALARGAMLGSLARIMSAQGTLMIALAGFSMIVHRLNRIVVISPIVDGILLLVFSVIVILSAQRSVWLAVGFGLSLMFCLYRNRSTVVAKMAMAVFVILLLLSTGLALFPETGSRLLRHFQGIVDPYSDGTASWRMEGWRQQLSGLQGVSLLFGQGLGGYYSWRQRGWDTVGSSPHNAYVQMMLKFGLLGLTIYGLLVFEFFRRTLAIRKKLRPGLMRAYVEMGILNFGAAHAYMMGYGIDPIILIFFALATVTVRLTQNSSRFARAVPVNRRSQVAFGSAPQFAPAPYRPPISYRG
jgi:hypothetical protein